MGNVIEMDRGGAGCTVLKGREKKKKIFRRERGFEFSRIMEHDGD